MQKLTVVAASLLACLVLSGCVVGRRTVPLEVSSAPSLGSPKGTVVIKSVSDNRRFENNPSDPSIPSIDGDVNSISADQKKAFIGRQRNTWGKAMGDIAMPQGQTVESKTFELIQTAFAKRGFAVSAKGDSKDNLEVSIDEFWAWFTPGFAAITFEAKVSCKLTLRRGSAVQNLTVKGQGVNKGQVASDANWQLAYSRAFEDFLKNLDAELAKAGF